VGKISLARSLGLINTPDMARFLSILTVAAFVLAGCEKPDPEQVEFEKKFDRDAVLVKTCRNDPTIESGPPMRVYRFQDKLWFSEYKRRWRQIDANPDNVCDVVEMKAAHRAKGLGGSAMSDDD
jgi:hypothetical protein